MSWVASLGPRRGVWSVPLAACAVLLLLATPPRLEAADTPSQVAVATENPTSTKAAFEQLQAGGNAVDAAVTAALVAGVANPTSSGLGGGCFINYFDRSSGNVYILDAREVAPANIVPQDFENRPFDTEARGKWVGVPGELAGLYELHSRFGKRSWAEVVQPAIDSAEQGFEVSQHMARAIGWSKDALAADPNLKALWLGRPFPAGSRAKNPRLAKTLTRIAAEGPKALYEGAIAAELSKTATSAGGALTTADLLAYKPKWRAPLRKKWAGYEIVTMPPPSAGGLMLLQTLALYSKGELQQLGFNTPAYQHMLAESFRAAFADRMLFVGDPDHEQVPLATLLDERRLRKRRELIVPNETRTIPEFAMEEHGTHHLTTVDGEGNAVALTTTVNRAFGAKLMAPSSGILLNDELDDFTSNGLMKHFGMQQSPNRARAHARPVSSMTPTLVLKDGEVILTAGGSGGLTIATNTTQAVLAHLAFDLPPKQILDAPRFQLPVQDATILVPKNAGKAHVESLKQRGEVVGDVRFTSTAVQLITARGGDRAAASDPRKFGLAEVGDAPKTAVPAPAIQTPPSPSGP